MDNQRDEIGFRTLALRVLQEHFPHIAVELLDDPERVRCTGFAKDARAEVYLGSVRQKCSGLAADDQVTLIQSFWSDLVACVDDDTTSLSWAEAQHRLRFQLLPPTAFINATRGDTRSSFVTRPLVTHRGESGLIQVLVIDRPRVIDYLRVDQPQQWGVPEKQLWGIALRNLAQATHPGDVETFSRDGCTIYSPRWTDGYAAARLLLPTVRAKVHAWAGGDVYIAIPNRDRLVAWARSHPPEIQRMAMELVTHMYETEDYPLCRGVFLVKRSPAPVVWFSPEFSPEGNFN